MKLNKRRTENEEIILKSNNIIWLEPYGYVKDWDGESGIPCNLIDILNILECKQDKR